MSNFETVPSAKDFQLESYPRCVKESMNSNKLQKVTLSTTSLCDVAAVKMALALGGARLNSLGLDVTLSSLDHIYCTDGLVMDGIPWRGNLTLGNGLSMSVVNAQTRHLTVDEFMEEESVVSETVPRRVRGGYFKPHEQTVWPAPDCGEYGERGSTVPEHLLESAWQAYVQLLTHPCALEMLESARDGWLKLNPSDE